MGSGKENKTKAQLIEEIEELAARLGKLERKAGRLDRSRRELEAENLLLENKSEKLKKDLKKLRKSRGRPGLSGSPEELYEKLIMTSPDAITASDLEGKITFASLQTAKFHGFRKPEDMIGVSAIELIAPEDRERAASNIEKTAESGIIILEPYTLLRKDGSTFCGELSAAVIRDEGGAPKGFIATTRDVTERKRAETALRESREKYSKLFKSELDAIILMDANTHKIIDANPSALALYGYTKDEILKLRAEDISVEPEATVETLEKSLMSGSARVPVRHHKAKNGRIFPVEISGSTYKTGSRTIACAIIREISERMIVEEELRKSEEKYRLLVNSIPAVTWISNNERITTFISPNIEQVYGYTPEEIYKSGEELWLGRVHPEDLELVERSYEDLLKGKDKFDVEYRIRRKDGKWIWIHDRALITYRVAEKTIAYGVFVDVTEHKKLEEEIRENERKYRELLEDLNEAITKIQLPSGIFTYVSPAAKDVFGYSPDDFLNTPQFMMKIIHPDYLDYYKNMAPELLRGNVPPTSEYKIIDSEGKIRWIYQSNKGIFDEKGEIIGIEALCRDVTTMKIAEMGIRESEYRYRKIFEEGPLGMVTSSSELNFTSANAAFCEMMGYDEEELMKMSFKNITHPEHLARDTENVMKLQRGEIPLYRTEKRYVRKDKTVIWGSLTVTSVCDENGDFMYFLTMVENITGRKRMEEELLKAQKLESIGILAGGIAHDFNNIITGLWGNIQLALLKTRESPDVQEMLLKSDKSCRRAADLTKQLLTFARGGAPIKETTSLDSLIEDTAEFVLRGSKAKPIIKIPSDLPLVDIDTTQISQVLENIIINADQAMPDGGIIEIMAESLDNDGANGLDANTLSPGKYVRISIRDGGIGISADNLNKIFDPYWTTKERGSGLGLSTCYSIIKKHSGHITVESDIGSGTTFHIYLPVSENNVIAEKDREEIETGSGRILVMDDDEDVREVTGKMLHKLGYEPDFVISGNEAIEIYRAAFESNRNYHAVILDLTVPGAMGGLETIKELAKIDPEVKAVLCSGYLKGSSSAEYEKYGLKEVINKPLDIKILSRTLKKIIG